MIEKANISSHFVSDLSYLLQIGDFIKKNRLAANMTQEDLADRAQVGRSTVIAIEKGNSITLLNLIQILRTLGKLSVLEAMAYKEEISPLQAAKLAVKKKERASGLQGKKTKTTDW